MRRPSHIEYHSTEHGSVFLFAVVVLAVILILGASLIERAQTAVFRSAVESRAVKSFHFAEAGIDKAIWALNQPNGWFTYDGESGISLPGGFVDVTVTPIPSLRSVFTEHLTVIATGYLPGPAGSQRLPRTIRVITHKDPRYFDYAVFAEEQVVIGNGTVELSTDSYNSDDGDYGGDNIGEDADIGTNSTAADAIVIQPQGEVNGDIFVGTDATLPDDCVDNQGTITGTITALDYPNLLPSIPSIPPGTTELGDIWLDNYDELVLDEGVYHITDLDVFGEGQVTCNGKVVLYMDQSTDAGSPDIRIGGNGIVNSSKIPANLILYCLDDVVSIEISGNGAFYGGIYAPNADIALNAGEVYGALVGRTVRLNGVNSAVHYDEALASQSNPYAHMRSWEVF